MEKKIFTLKHLFRQTANTVIRIYCDEHLHQYITTERTLLTLCILTYNTHSWICIKQHCR